MFSLPHKGRSNVYIDPILSYPTHTPLMDYNRFVVVVFSIFILNWRCYLFYTYFFPIITMNAILNSLFFCGLHCSSFSSTSVYKEGLVRVAFSREEI